MTELEQYIQTYFGVNKQEAIAISDFFKPITLDKGNFFLKAGRYSDQLGFVKTGLMREFLFVDHKEVTKSILTTCDFVVDMASFVFNQPARWNIQALTDCELYVINSVDNEKIGQKIPRWQELERFCVAKFFAGMEDRIVQLLSLSAKERYEQFLNSNRELFQQVPLQYLASMLGMTPETFSRIRRKNARA
jgi:CRP-like cAMP-binding protein